MEKQDIPGHSFLPEIVIKMQGRLEYEPILNLKIQLQSLGRNHPHSTIILDFQQLDFVGSSGIGNFVELLNFLKKDQIRIRLINVKGEFLKVFRLYQFDEKEFLGDKKEKDSTKEKSTLKELGPSPL